MEVARLVGPSRSRGSGQDSGSGAAASYSGAHALRQLVRAGPRVGRVGWGPPAGPGPGAGRHSGAAPPGRRHERPAETAPRPRPSPPALPPRRLRRPPRTPPRGPGPGRAGRRWRPAGAAGGRGGGAADVCNSNDMYDACEALDPDVQVRRSGLRATHSIADYMAEPDKNFAAKIERDEAAGIERPDIPEAEHPVVVHHPDTGDEILYVSRGITRRIVGMERAESSALLKQLHLHATQPGRVYGHDWPVGDLVMFDTLGTMHRRDAWDPTERRRMRQLSTACVI